MGAKPRDRLLGNIQDYVHGNWGRFEEVIFRDCSEIVSSNCWPQCLFKFKWEEVTKLVSVFNAKFWNFCKILPQFLTGWYQMCHRIKILKWWWQSTNSVPEVSEWNTLLAGWQIMTYWQRLLWGTNSIIGLQCDYIFISSGQTSLSSHSTCRARVISQLRLGNGKLFGKFEVNVDSVRVDYVLDQCEVLNCSHQCQYYFNQLR